MAFLKYVTIAYPGWNKLLDQRGLLTVDAVYRFHEGTILKGGPGAATELRRVEFRGEKQTHVLYIKKYSVSDGALC